jgi:DNA mismatch repair protein MutS2
VARDRTPSRTAIQEQWQAVSELSEGIADFTLLLRHFRNKILPDGTLDDRASSELARIRREIEKQKRTIQESLRAYLRRLSEGGAVQEELVTIRGERFVIPVKTEQRRRVQGVAHGTSSSGQTVFIEPLETIEQNNDLVRLLEEEQAEIHRILLDMTARLGERADELAHAVNVLVGAGAPVCQSALRRRIQLRCGQAAGGQPRLIRHSRRCQPSRHHRSKVQPTQPRVMRSSCAMRVILCWNAP